MANITSATCASLPKSRPANAVFRAYRRPSLLFSAHLETIYPALLRRVRNLPFSRERLVTQDDDFLDLDWLRRDSLRHDNLRRDNLHGDKFHKDKGHDDNLQHDKRQKDNGQNGEVHHDPPRLVILSHGLEGSSRRAYITGMARALSNGGYDVVAWNFRGCSDEMNRQLRFYHSGATDDLQAVVDHALAKGYRDISLVGFSLGGNVTLKYLGELSGTGAIRKAVAFSVPLDLYHSCLKISQPENFLYSRRFLRNLIRKVKRKAVAMPGLDLDGIDKLKTLIEFDDRYTAPLHGFQNARDYYQRCSALFFLNDIAVPTLIVNAQNDPFLSDTCFPSDIGSENPHVTFEAPAHGGHVGFAQFNKNGLYWSEQRALAFLNSPA